THPTTAVDLHGFAGTAPDDVWAVGDGATLHFDGQRWTAAAAPSPMFAAWSPAKGDVWAVAGNRVVHRSGASSWLTSLTVGWLYGIHGTGPSDLWAVGEAGAAWHFDGTGWTLKTPGPMRLW